MSKTSGLMDQQHDCTFDGFKPDLVNASLASKQYQMVISS